MKSNEESFKLVEYFVSMIIYHPVEPVNVSKLFKFFYSVFFSLFQAGIISATNVYHGLYILQLKE